MIESRERAPTSPNAREAPKPTAATALLAITAMRNARRSKPSGAGFESTEPPEPKPAVPRSADFGRRVGLSRKSALRALGRLTALVGSWVDRRGSCMGRACPDGQECVLVLGLDADSAAVGRDQLRVKSVEESDADEERH